jgi:hypothetical protein
MKKGRCGTMTHDYKRNGTATLFAALNALEGEVISMCNDRHRHQEWLKFLRVIDDTEESTGGPGPYAQSSPGDSGCHRDARRMAADNRSPMVGDAAIHAAGNRTGNSAAQAAASSAATAASANQAATPFSVR